MLSNKAQLALFDIRDNCQMAQEFVKGMFFDSFMVDRRFYVVTRALEIIASAMVFASATKDAM
jgi:hypothetical protein